MPPSLRRRGNISSGLQHKIHHNEHKHANHHDTNEDISEAVHFTYTLVADEVEEGQELDASREFVTHTHTMLLRHVHCVWALDTVELIQDSATRDKVEGTGHEEGNKEPDQTNPAGRVAVVVQSRDGV